MLLKYLDKKERGEWGWVPRYEAEISERFEGKDVRQVNWAYLSGHYSALLEQIIDALGVERTRRLAYALLDIDDAVHEIAARKAAPGEEESRE